MDLNVPNALLYSMNPNYANNNSDSDYILRAFKEKKAGEVTPEEASSVIKGLLEVIG